MVIINIPIAVIVDTVAGNLQIVFPETKVFMGQVKSIVDNGDHNRVTGGCDP